MNLSTPSCISARQLRDNPDQTLKLCGSLSRISRLPSPRLLVGFSLKLRPLTPIQLQMHHKNVDLFFGVLGRFCELNMREVSHFSFCVFRVWFWPRLKSCREQEKDKINDSPSDNINFPFCRTALTCGLNLNQNRKKTKKQKFNWNQFKSVNK